MAVTVTPILPDGVTAKAWDIIATADADAAAVIPHGFGRIPEAVQLTPLLAQAYTSVWTLGVVDATNINLVKGTGGGSGTANAQLRVNAQIPHSIVR